MRRAKELGITVLLSGQGADELLCGYKKYLGFYIQWLVENRQYGKALNVLYQYWRNGTILSQFNVAEARRYMPAYFRKKNDDVLGDAVKDYTQVQMGRGKGMTVQQRQYEDVKRFSVPVLTHYEDRMSMAFSREIRLPFLDHRLMDVLLPMPVHYKMDQGWTKYIFRRAVSRLLPSEIVWRKDKQGFVNPQSEWLKHELRSSTESYFDSSSLIFKYRLVNRNNLLQKYKRYCKQPAMKGPIWFREIFSPLALEIWLRRYEEHIC